MNDPATDIYIGTMSGTSMDGLDIVAVHFDDDAPRLLQQQTTPYPNELKDKLSQLTLTPNATIDDMCALDTQLGQFYAQQIKAFIANHSFERKHIAAIGSHGQTIRHAPSSTHPYTLQIGDPNIIAAACNITVVADFRRRDLALGGQGAPLTPAFHQQTFRSPRHDRCIINIGGIANITNLPRDTTRQVSGFDSGPGNTLMDSFCRQKLHCEYDKNGDIARSGQLDDDLLQAMLSDAYFTRPAPKSTGTDYFSPHWLQQFELDSRPPANILNTLTELTATTIAHATDTLDPDVQTHYICGGGAHNRYLLERLAHHLQPATVTTTSSLGLHPDWVEATAFAWLARQTLLQLPGNLPSVTNAKYPTILGAVHFPNGQ